MSEDVTVPGERSNSSDDAPLDCPLGWLVADPGTELCTPEYWSVPVSDVPPAIAAMNPQETSDALSLVIAMRNTKYTN